MDINELTKWVVNRGDDLYSLDKQVQFQIKLEQYAKEQLILFDVGCSCANKKEKPKAPSNRIVNNTRPVADSKKA